MTRHMDLSPSRSPKPVHPAEQWGSERLPLRVGVVGAGRGGTAVLQLFASAPAVRVVVVADPDPEAPGLPLARAREIPVISSHREIFAYAPQIVIEVTGRPEVREELWRTKPADVEVVGAQSARLFWELVMLRAREAQQLEKADTIRRMTGGVFHSMNNLFTTLVGRTGLLLHSLETNQWTRDQLGEGLQIIARNVTRGSEILRRLREFMRQSAEQPVTRLDLNGLIREVLALTDPLIREAQGRSATIEVRQELGKVPPVVGRPSELLEVLVNLIVNAIEAMPGGGVLAIESAVEDRNVLLRVRDSGIGIPDAVKVHLFTPFFTTKAGGTGLGLSVSREILRRHGGDLAIESAEGRGTCATVTLPAAEVDREAPLPELQKLRVLVVDDDPFFRDILVGLLTAEGYLVTGAAGGEEALACLKREVYELVLADIVMPGVMGWEVARAARAQDPAPAVILFTGWAVPPEDPALQESGAEAFLEKPIQVPDLLETVRGVLRKRVRPPG